MYANVFSRVVIGQVNFAYGISVIRIVFAIVNALAFIYVEWKLPFC